MGVTCMKCGREISLGQVFCKDCLSDMQAHPVKPGTPVVLPIHEPINTARRTNARKIRKPEEQITLLRKLLLIVSISFLIVSLALAITISVLIANNAEDDPASLPGQNYSTEESAL